MVNAALIDKLRLQTGRRGGTNPASPSHGYGIVTSTLLRDPNNREPSQSCLDNESAMKSETPAQRYRREADECQLNAQRAIRAADREAWLKLAVDWRKLAESAELNPMLDTRRH